MKPPTIHLHIEELNLIGFPATHRHHIGDAVKQELARLLTDNSLAEWSNADVLDGGSFIAAPESKPAAIGTQIANSVFRAVGADKREV